MAEDDYDKWSNNKPSLRPNSHASRTTVLNEYIYCSIPSIDVRSKGEIDARETNGSISKALVPSCMSKETKRKNRINVIP